MTAVLIVTMVCLDVAFANRTLEPISDYDFRNEGEPRTAQVELGRLLFNDKILSGNKNISCATCHHALTDTGDGLSLPVGEGGSGLGVARNSGFGENAIVERVPRNAQPLFNLGAKEFDTMFHDGRVQVDLMEASGFLSPAGDDLPIDLDDVLAAQAMFPVTSAAEMAGQAGENPQADFAAANDLPHLWEFIADKLREIPEYVEKFTDVYDDIETADDITYSHAANAIAAFESEVFRFDNSPYDRYLRGDVSAMNRAARRGLWVFYRKDKGNCVACHSGRFQTDHKFHSIGMPQIGPGKGDNQDGYSDGHDDFGRERVTGQRSDRFKFRTPTLRNVTLTAPYGHDGAYDSLEAIILHHLDPVTAIANYDLLQAKLPSREDLDATDFVVMNDAKRLAEIIASSEIEPKELSKAEISDLIEFLRALTDPNALDLRDEQPMRVPSRLPLAD